MWCSLSNFFTGISSCKILKSNNGIIYGYINKFTQKQVIQQQKIIVRHDRY